MDIEKLSDSQYFDSKEIITHREDSFSEPGRIIFKEIKQLETRFVTDGEILNVCNRETLDIDNYTLDDGYIIEGIDYIRKKQIAFKNCTYVISFDLVLKKNNKNDSDIHIDIINFNVYLKDVNDIELLNKVRKISKSIKKTYRKINSSISSYIKLSSIKTIDKYESENISENVYRIKK